MPRPLDPDQGRARQVPMVNDSSDSCTRGIPADLRSALADRAVLSSADVAGGLRMKGLRGLLLGLVLACLPSLALAEQEVWVAYTDGVIDIAPDGSVEAFEVKESLGKNVDAFIERQVEDWKFQPVIENGQPIPVRGKAYLTLHGIGGGGKSMQVSIAEARFYELAAGSHEALESVGNDFPPPGYPPRAFEAGVGANVLAIVRISRDGEVVDVEMERTDLRYRERGRTEKKSDLHATYFEDAIRRVVPSWRVNPRNVNFDASGQARVRIPVNFDLGMRWGLLVSIDGPALDEPDGGEAKIAEFAMAGMPTSDRIALRTELNPASSGG